jgi:hypothetical protein
MSGLALHAYIVLMPRSRFLHIIKLVSDNDDQLELLSNV